MTITDLIVKRCASVGLPNSQESSAASVRDVGVERSGIFMLVLAYVDPEPFQYLNPSLFRQIGQVEKHLSWVGPPPSMITMETMITPTMTKILMLDNQNSNSPNRVIPK
jgi:hypothetical protein